MVQNNFTDESYSEKSVLYVFPGESVLGIRTGDWCGGIFSASPYYVFVSVLSGAEQGFDIHPEHPCTRSCSCDPCIMAPRQQRVLDAF